MDKRKEHSRELILYVVFGVMTTLVCMVTLQVQEKLLRPRLGDHSYLITNIPAFIAGLIFAFIVNKLFVFQQKSWAPRLVLREAFSFAGVRVLSFAVFEYFPTVVLYDWLWPKVDPWFTPLWNRYGMLVPVPNDAYRFLARWGIAAVLSVIANYILSRLIFKKKPPAALPAQEEAAQ
jgi:putative flippase GtrA